MKTIKVLILTLLITVTISCNQKNVKLPMLAVHGIQDTIYNNSKIWIFYKIEVNDTIAEINKNNKIANTHWLFNIDKRLSLKHIIPTIKKLQEKKEKPSMHDNGEVTHQYYSYVDTVSNKLSLVLFDSVKYVTTKEIVSLNDNFKHIQINQLKNNIYINNTIVDIDTVNQYLSDQIDSVKLQIHLNFNKNVNYQNYIHLKAMLQNIENDSIVIDKNEVVKLEY